METITFDVEGKTKYRVARRRFSAENTDTIGMLKDMVSDCKETEMYIDEDDEFFRVMLEYYRTGILEKPKTYHMDIWNFKCKYWNLPYYTEMDYALYFTTDLIKEYDAKTGYAKLNISDDDVYEEDSDYINVKHLFYFGTDKYNIYTKDESILIPCGVTKNNIIRFFNIDTEEYYDFTDVNDRNYGYPGYGNFIALGLSPLLNGYWIYIEKRLENLEKENKLTRNKHLEESFFRRLEY